MSRRVAWWMCLGVLGGLLGVQPVARAQEPAHGVLVEEPAPADPAPEPVPAEPVDDAAPTPPLPEPEPGDAGALEDPDWEAGEDHPAQLEHVEVT